MSTGETLDPTAALGYASTRGYDQIVAHLLPYTKTAAAPNLVTLLERMVCRAAVLGYVKQVSLFIDYGADPNAAPDNITPLQHATRNGHTSLVHCLLSNGKVDVDSKTGTDTDKPILLAVRKGYEPVAQRLLAAHADLNCLTMDGSKRTPLYLAAEHGHKAIVHHLLAAEDPAHRVLDNQSSSGTSPLIIACMKEYSEIAKLLLDTDASVKLCDSNGHTALYHTLRPGSENLAMQILERVSSVDEIKDIGDIFLRAAYLGFITIIRRCLDAGALQDRALLTGYSDREAYGRKALHGAAFKGRYHIVRLLLSLGADVDPQDSMDLTPLALAAEAGEADIVELLLAYSADARLKTTEGETIVSRVAKVSEDSSRHASVVKMLLDAGTDPMRLTITRGMPYTGLRPWESSRLSRPSYGIPPLTLSLLEVAELLISAGADPLGLDIDGWLPTHLASQSGNIALLELLWERNPESLEARANDGRTIIHFGLPNPESIRWLLGHQADGNGRDNTGCTPLMTAAIEGLDDAVHNLLDSGCSASTVQETAKITALHFAGKSDGVHVGRALLKNNPEILSYKDAANLSALHLAICSRSTDFVVMLLDEFYSKADKTCLRDLSAVGSDDGETPLISAVRRGHEGVVRRLVMLGAETEYRDKRADSALLEAVSGSNVTLEMLRALLDPNVPNHAKFNAGGGARGKFNTALSAAAFGGYDDIARFLLELPDSKADPNIPAGHFANALSAAVRSQTYELVTPLLEADTNVNATDIQGRSAFHIAAHRGAWDTIPLSGELRSFLSILADEEMDWDIEIKDSHGWTPLHWACRHNNSLDIVEALVQCGADFKHVTEEGWSPENISATHGALNIFDYVEQNLMPVEVSSFEDSTRKTDSDGREKKSRHRRWKT
ncbi:ankyrin repeat-containing domain protein [Podospora didyma]|uniref:Ankyrin repeat-containing domain protein n=1 Tax=Podospora didyma TaxID=330526 RepID=A0AAE0N278_9PEZI|nr:ankyrin repeat-containing domain protein [Podospora didyma]